MLSYILERKFYTYISNRTIVLVGQLLYNYIQYIQSYRLTSGATVASKALTNANVFRVGLLLTERAVRTRIAGARVN